jgi:hypothetical protein
VHRRRQALQLETLRELGAGLTQGAGAEAVDQRRGQRRGGAAVVDAGIQQPDDAVVSGR